jgi:hypothetical protein
MENLNNKKIEYLKYENIEMDNIVKYHHNHHENLYHNEEEEKIIFNQNNKIRDLERKNKSLYDIYFSLKILYPLKYRKN